MPERIASVNLLPVPPGLAAEVAAMVEPLACCLRGVERAEVEQGDRVAILGAGPIGLMLCACVADAGGKAEVVGGRPERRELVPALRRRDRRRRGRRRRDRGGRHRRGLAARARARPAGRHRPLLRRPRAGAELRVDAYRLHYEELTLRGAFHHAPRHVRAALAFLASGAYPWERLVTHRVGLEGVAGAPRRPAARLPQGRGRPLAEAASARARARRASTATHAHSTPRTTLHPRGA